MQSPSRFLLHTTNYACLICRVVLCRHLAHTNHRLLYNIHYGTTQPMIKSGILFCAYHTNQRLLEKGNAHTLFLGMGVCQSYFFLFNYLHCTAAPHWEITSTGRWMHCAAECLRLPYPCQRVPSPSGPRRVSCTMYGQRCTDRARWSGVRASCPPR